MSDKSALPKLSTSDWAVLAALAEGEAHGFHLAALFSAGGELGSVWSIQRPQVYRVLEHLTQAGLARAVRREPGLAGPQRTVFAATEAGRGAVEEWLRLPVTRLRLGRSELRLKLIFLLRSGADWGPLLSRQRAHYQRTLHTLEAQEAHQQGVGRIVLLWRLEHAKAGLRFVERLLAEGPPRQ
ncbi:MULTISPECIES: PadR family transcriptional regulator [unclassified Meiothermus]|uniref:PadR family transcriptional regulator n=1 Tax=unclassified Meiothermus TaxID=370471 RepID=UPI000D7BE68C|nr:MULTISPECIES: PadR family transcriptional regulator [unclassified Meiothermus]PZA06469.1 PadR family transcriptional regulator [Meiothermus sp. Pnk-1]RYM36264.1 PadR family transcriptional regulator [Meiothermus sp. PNK-Is4]